MREDHLPIGSTIHIGQCILQVTPEPHNACALSLETDLVHQHLLPVLATNT